MNPPFGYKVPENAVAAWGARLIVTQDGLVDLVPGRYGFDRLLTSDELKTLDRYPLTQLLDDIEQQLQDGTINTRVAEEIVFYDDDELCVWGNSNGSAGYFYVTAWLKDEQLAHALNCPAETVIAVAKDLASEDGENPEYDRALVEFTVRLLGGSMDAHASHLADRIVASSGWRPGQAPR